MRVIALDTTTRRGSIAIVEDDRIVDEREGDDERTHAQRLPAQITTIAAAHGLRVADVDLFAVASGPGSFTGLRIGIATIQGLAFVTLRRAIGIPALDALAEAGSAQMPPGSVVAAWMDAHRHEVFAAAYRVTEATPFHAGHLVELEAPTAGDPASTLARWREALAIEPGAFIGDGAMLYRDIIEAHLPDAQVRPAPPLAGVVGRLAVARYAEAVAPGDLRALYVRRPDAVLERERRSLEPG